MTVKIRYCMFTADDCGVRVNPVTQMTNLGYDLITWEYSTVADTYVFVVKELIEPLPSYLEVIS